MSRAGRAWVILFGFVAAGVLTGHAQQGPGSVTPVFLPNTYQHVVQSRVNGATYVIQVALPSSYAKGAPGSTTRYPALYLLDGNLVFPFYLAQRQYGVRPRDLILVGVSAADSQTVRRQWDYSPPLTKADSAWADSAWGGLRGPPSGGAPQFLRVLKEEIIPLVDRFYPTSGDRGIEGASLGGLFVAYTMFEEPDLFTRYALVSPSLFWPFAANKKRVIMDRERDFAKQHSTFAKTVFVSVGAEEDRQMIGVAQDFLTQLCSSMGQGAYKGLDLATEIVAGQGHASLVARLQVIPTLYPTDSTKSKPRRSAMEGCG